MRTISKRLKQFFVVLAIFLSIFAFSAGRIFAQSQTPTTSPSPSQVSTEEADLKVLKDKLASVVARLKENDQLRAGVLLEIGEKSLVIEVSDNQKEKVTLDDVITQYIKISGSAKEDMKKEDVKVGDYLIVAGYTGDEGLTANEIYVDTPFETTAGRATEINTVNSSIKLDTFDKEGMTVNIARSSIVEVISTSTGLVVQSGFGSIKEGDVVHIVYEKPRAKTITSVTPVRVLIIPSQYFASQ